MNHRITIFLLRYMRACACLYECLLPFFDGQVEVFVDVQQDFLKEA